MSLIIIKLYAITAKAGHYYNSIIIITRLYYYSNALLRIMYGSTIHYRLWCL